MISIEFNYSSDDYVRASRFMRKRLTWWRSISFTVGIFAPLLALFGKRAFLNLAWLAPIIAIWLVLLIAMPMYEDWNVRRQVKNTPAAEGLFTCTFSNEGLHLVGSLEEFEWKWEALVRVVESDEDFHFYGSESFVKFLPKRAFISDSQQNQLRMLLKTRIGHKAQLSL